MQTYTLDRSGASPLYEQLYRALKADILSGALPGGSRLPSVRSCFPSGIRRRPCGSAPSMTRTPGCTSFWS